MYVHTYQFLRTYRHTLLGYHLCHLDQLLSSSSASSSACFSSFYTSHGIERDFFQIRLWKKRGKRGVEEEEEEITMNNFFLSLTHTYKRCIYFVQLCCAVDSICYYSCCWNKSVARRDVSSSSSRGLDFPSENANESIFFVLWCRNGNVWINYRSSMNKKKGRRKTDKKMMSFLMPRW